MSSSTPESTGRIFFSTSSSGPGLLAIFSLRSSASLALFSFICVACREGSACVSDKHREDVHRRSAQHPSEPGRLCHRDSQQTQPLIHKYIYAVIRLLIIRAEHIHHSAYRGAVKDYLAGCAYGPVQSALVCCRVCASGSSQSVEKHIFLSIL